MRLRLPFFPSLLPTFPSVLSLRTRPESYFSFWNGISYNTTQRRTRQPYGLEGGGPGALGRNTWIKQLRAEDGDLTKENGALEERHINIGGKATVWMGKGDRLRIETPGGGAWGAPGEQDGAEAAHVRGWEPRGSVAERAAAQAAF